MSNTHIELHICPTAKDAARLAIAGLPRYDLEPSTCGNCNNRVGEVNRNNGESLDWKPLAVVVWDNGVDVLCERCTKSVTAVVGKA